MRISAAASAGPSFSITSPAKKSNSRPRAVPLRKLSSGPRLVRAASSRIIAAGQPSVSSRSRAAGQSRPCRSTRRWVSSSVKRNEGSSSITRCWFAIARAYSGGGGSRLMAIRRTRSGSSASAAAMPACSSGALPNSCALSSTSTQGRSSASASRRKQRRMKAGTSRKSSAPGKGRCSWRRGARCAAAARRKWAKVAGSASPASSCSHRHGVERSCSQVATSVVLPLPGGPAIQRPGAAAAASIRANKCSRPNTRPSRGGLSLPSAG